jgi:unsaturated rhamnogalacturonyl hydrolase
MKTTRDRKIMDRQLIDGYVDRFLAGYRPYQNYWNYEDGCVLTGCIRLYEATGDRKFRDFVIRYLDSRVDADGTINTFDCSQISLDSFNCGKAFFFALDETKNEKYRKALDFLMERLAAYPRCRCGNFIHKDIYPGQVWLDGLYMAEPLYMEYETRFRNREHYDDIVLQFDNVKKYMFNSEKGLFYHGFDEDRVQLWADSRTGCSGSFWARACGWWLMALADTMDVMADFIYEQYRDLEDLFRLSVKGMLPYADKKTGLFCQVVDLQDAEGNYQETSGSAMVAYAVMKGCRKGILLPDKYLDRGRRIFESLCETKLKDAGNGKTVLTDICKVAGLGPGEKRDGTPEYYFSEPKTEDDAKGVGPFFMAYAEYIRSEKDSRTFREF